MKPQVPVPPFCNEQQNDFSMCKMTKRKTIVNNAVMVTQKRKRREKQEIPH
jgi:hypothetical protein